MEKKVKQKGICPYCSSNEIEIIDVQDDGYCTEQICKCNQCKNKFIETYYLDYSYTKYDELMISQKETA